MSLSSRLRSQRSDHYASIAREQENLRRLEALYASLQRFSTNVDQTKGDFSTINNRKQTLLSDIDCLKMNCRTSAKYEEGMLVVLDGVGTKIVAMSLGQLKTMIIAQQVLYKTQIEICRANIVMHQLRIAELDVEIRAAEAAEEAAREAEREARRAARAAKKAASSVVDEIRSHFQ